MKNPAAVRHGAKLRSFARSRLIPCTSVSPRSLCAAALALAVAAGACRASPPGSERIQPVYDKATGKLQLLKYDANGNGKVDTWSYMDGTRVVRIEIDQ